MRIYVDFKSKPAYGPIIDVVNFLARNNEVLYSRSKRYMPEGLDCNVLVARSRSDVNSFNPQVVFSAYSAFAALALWKIQTKAPMVNYRFIHTTLEDVLSFRFKDLPRDYRIREILNLTSLGLPRRLWIPNRFLLPNHKSKQDLISLGIDEERLEMLPWGVRTERYDAVAKGSASNSADSESIVYAGPLHKLRFSASMVDAFGNVVQNHQDTTLKLLFRGVWDHKLLQMIRSKIKKLGIESRVTIVTRPLAHQRLVEHICKASVVYLPYLMSGIVEMPPLTLIEAMALQRPIITSHGIATSDIIRNRYNGLVTRQDPRSIGIALDYLLTNKTEAEELGKKAREFVENRFRFPKFCKRLQTVLESVA